MHLNWAHFVSIWFLACGLLLGGGVSAQESDSGEAVAEEGGAAPSGQSDPGANEAKLGSRTHLIPEAIEQAALADETIKKQVVWLETPEGLNGADISFLGLEQLEQTAEAHGSVLLLHGVEQHPDWPQVIKPLRTTLPEDGWYTLSIMLPYLSYLAPPARELASKESDSVLSVDGVPRFSGRSLNDNATKGSNSQGDALNETGGGANDGDAEDSSGADGEAEAEPTETADDLERADGTQPEELIDISLSDKKEAAPAKLTFDKKVQLRIDAAFSKLLAQGYQNIVLIGYQQGAQGILDYLSLNKGQLPEKGLTVIWIDARLKEQQSPLVGELIGDNFTLLLLDVVDSSSREARAEARIRAGVAKRKGYDGYTQIKLPIAEMRGEALSTLTQRIRAWLKVNAPGMSAETVETPQ